MSSPSPSAPPPVAISTRSSARLLTGYTPGTAAPLIYARARIPPPPGAGEERRRRGWGGGAEGVCGYLLPAKAQAGWGRPAEGYG